MSDTNTRMRKRIIRQNDPVKDATNEEVKMDEATLETVKEVLAESVEDTRNVVETLVQDDREDNRKDNVIDPLEAHANKMYLANTPEIADVHFVDRALEQIPDDFVVKNKREKEDGITKLLDTYKKYSDKSSFYPMITPETTGREIKDYIKKMKFVEQIEMAYIFLLYSGKLHEVFDYEQETKRWRIRFLQWGGYSILFLFVAIIGGVVTAGVIRNDIDSNEFIRMFMDLVNKFTEMFVTGTPQVPD